MTDGPRPDNVSLIVSGRIRVGESWERGHVWVADGRIVDVTQDSSPSVTHDIRRLDVGDSFVLAGAVDAHVHCLSHDGEGVDAGTRSAAAGGVTTIVEMPYDGAGAINSRDRLAAKQELVARECHIDVALLGTLAPEGGWRDAEALASGGVVGFKVSLFLTDPVRFPRIGDGDLRDVMKAVAECGRTLCVHAENNEIIQGLLAREKPAMPTDPAAHLRTRPPVSESLGALTALEIAAEQGTSLHLCHLSLPRSVDLVGWYQSQGTDVTLESCPHYLAFTEADMERLGGLLKINPPLRDKAAQTGLWERLSDHRISIISSDHAPWPLSFKTNPHILENHSGVPGVETLVAVTLGGALRRDPTLATFGAAVDALTINPARRYGIDGRKGSLAVGKDADIMVFAPSTDYAIDGGALHSNAGWSPYDGFRPSGRVTHTISRGTIVWDSEAGLSSVPGRGELVTRP